jgi:hypothetical protein
MSCIVLVSSRPDKQHVRLTASCTCSTLTGSIMSALRCEIIKQRVAHLRDSCLRLKGVRDAKFAVNLKLHLFRPPVLFDHDR